METTPYQREYNKRYYARDKEKAKNRVRAWRKKNPEKYKALSLRSAIHNREALKQWRLNLKTKIITHYTNGKNSCQCCDESNFEFLTIDHIIPVGKKGKRERSIYSYLVENNFPKGYQILCYNCNMGKRMSSQCPHKRVKD